MKLLYIAETVFTRYRDQYHGPRVFGREFFEDYLAVFSEVAICARVKTAEWSVQNLPINMVCQQRKP